MKKESYLKTAGGQTTFAFVVAELIVFLGLPLMDFVSAPLPFNRSYWFYVSADFPFVAILGFMIVPIMALVAYVYLSQK